jgi:hypothetical protein
VDADCREKSLSVSALITIMSKNMVINTGLTPTVMNTGTIMSMIMTTITSMNTNIRMVLGRIMAKSTHMHIRTRTAIPIRMSTGIRTTTSTAIPTAEPLNCANRFWRRTNAWRNAIAVSFMRAACWL